jgi:hypothetical protein
MLMQKGASASRALRAASPMNILLWRSDANGVIGVRQEFWRRHTTLPWLTTGGAESLAPAP